MWGPDFSGEATLEVGPASITVGFGSERRVPGRVLPWGEFVAKYLEDAGGAARTLSAITGRGTLPSATASTADLASAARLVLAANRGMIEEQGLTLIGITLSGLDDADALQLEIPFPAER